MKNHWIDFQVWVVKIFLSIMSDFSFFFLLLLGCFSFLCPSQLLSFLSGRCQWHRWRTLGSNSTSAGPTVPSLAQGCRKSFCSFFSSLRREKKSKALSFTCFYTAYLCQHNSLLRNLESVTFSEQVWPAAIRQKSSTKASHVSKAWRWKILDGLGVLSTPTETCDICPLVLTGGGSTFKAISVYKGKQNAESIGDTGADHLWAQSTPACLCVPDIPDKAQEAKPHISPSLQAQHQIKELERKWGPTEWLVLQDRMQRLQ